VISPFSSSFAAAGVLDFDARSARYTVERVIDQMMTPFCYFHTDFTSDAGFRREFLPRGKFCGVASSSPLSRECFFRRPE